MTKYRIDGEQGWLDNFNDGIGTNYQENQILDLSEREYEQLISEFNYFNNMIAFGPALDLIEVEE